MYHKWKSYDVWFLKYGAWQTECFVIFDNFLPFYPPNSPKNENFEKWKKCLEISLFYIYAPEIMIICYTVPEIWYVTEISVIFHFWLFFALLPPNLPKKWKLKKKRKKKPGDIIILHKCTKNHNHMLYCSWNMTCDRCNCYFSVWAIFCPFTPITVQENKIFKK